MQNIQINIGGKDLTFVVKFDYDADMGKPWENSDCHGVVTDWVSRDKLPGELVLNSGHSGKRFYDYAESCKIALRDGWDAFPYNDGTETKRQQAAKAALSDYEYLRSWCNDEWQYMGVTVILLDDEGNETDVQDSLWGVENKDDAHETAAKKLADELAHGYGTRWGEVEKKTFAFI